jgi:hypothetical protein
MARDAKPMIWPYLYTGSPVLMSASATLWPRPIGSRTSIVRSASVTMKPRGIGRAATATVSLVRKTTALGPSTAAAIFEPLWVSEPIAHCDKNPV